LRERVRVADVRTGPAEERARGLNGAEVAGSIRPPILGGRERDPRRQVLLLARPSTGIGRNERIGRHGADNTRTRPYPCGPAVSARSRPKLMCRFGRDQWVLVGIDVGR
jgi:hypothetical protein